MTSHMTGNKRHVIKVCHVRIQSNPSNIMKLTIISSVLLLVCANSVLGNSVLGNPVLTWLNNLKKITAGHAALEHRLHK